MFRVQVNNDALKLCVNNIILYNCFYFFLLNRQRIEMKSTHESSIFIHTLAHKYIHTHIRTYIHTYTDMYSIMIM